MEEKIKLIYTDLKGAECSQFFDRSNFGQVKLDNKLVWLAGRKLEASIEYQGKVVGHVSESYPSWIWSYENTLFPRK